MIALIQDLVALAEQFLPGLMILFPGQRYRFSRVDLDGAGARSSSRTHVDPSSSCTVLATFDLLSYNVNHACVRSPDRSRRVVHAIIASRADVVLLQETNPAWRALP